MVKSHLIHTRSGSHRDESKVVKNEKLFLTQQSFPSVLHHHRHQLQLAYLLQRNKSYAMLRTWLDGNRVEDGLGAK